MYRGQDGTTRRIYGQRWLYIEPRWLLAPASAVLFVSMAREKILIETSRGVLTLRQIAEATGIPNEIIRSRYYKGWRGDKLLESYKHEAIIRTEYRGEMKSLYEIAEAEGLPSQTVIQRYRRGERGASLWEQKRYSKPIDRIGEKHGLLTIIGIRKEKEGAIAVCKCECGNICEKPVSSLVSRRYIHSCGCHRGEWCRIHGMSQTREHRIWRKIIERCYNKNCKAYKNYGGRGILMSDEWHNSFLVFFNDMGASPGPEYSIDRIDNEKGYCKENCRWATKKQQARNQRDTIYVEYNGAKKPIGDWADELGVSYARVARMWKNHHDISPLFTH